MGQSETYRNYIGGEWCEGSTGKWENNLNPANPTQVLGRLTLSSSDDVKRAIDSAEKAQEGWARVPRPVRGSFIKKASEIISSRIDQFARAMSEEEGKNLSEARGEVLKSINVMEFMASEGRRPVGKVIPSEMPSTFIYTVRAPLGVVAAITPWNFPLCIPAWKIAPALLEGNTVLFKPASLTPACAVLLVEAFIEAGLPKGVLNLVLGSGSVVGEAIVNDPRVHAISFTGSNEVGTDLYAKAARRLCKVQLEMGGKNALIVCADADLDQAAEAAVSGAYGSTGQRCTATSRVIVEKSVHAALAAKILERVRGIRTGDGVKEQKVMGPVVDAKQYASVVRAIQAAKKEGAKLLHGGEASETLASGQGYFVPATLFDDVLPSMRLARDEVFGPVLAIIPVADFEEAIRVTNDCEYGLSSSVYTKDIQKVMAYADRVDTGMLHVNSPTVGGEAQAPFGGTKGTGLGGREMGSTGPEFFCEIKTVYIDTNQAVRQGNLY